MTREYGFAVTCGEEGIRLDLFLQQKISSPETDGALSRSRLQRLIADGKVSVNGDAASKNYRTRTGDRISMTVGPAEPSLVSAEDLPIDVVFEDDFLIVVNKPKGMVVHPAPGHAGGTLVNALLYHLGDRLSGINGVKRPGILHRIDKDTSGLLVAAKDDASHIFLARQLADHSMEREYRAVVHGRFSEPGGTVDLPIGRSAADRKKFAVRQKNSRAAVTEYTVFREYERFSDLSLRLKTGRTHQIRVHMASIGHPVAGDRVYGSKVSPKEFSGQCLHAKTLGFLHPKTRDYMRFDSELPEYYTRFIASL